MNNIDVRICEKYALTKNEAAIYFNIGENKLDKIISSNPSAPYLLRNGKKVTFKRELFAEFLDGSSEI